MVCVTEVLLVSKLLSVPKKMLKQSIDLVVETNKNDDDFSFADDDTIKTNETINNVFVQLATVYSGAGDERKVTGNGKVFIYADKSTPFPELDPIKSVGNKLNYNGHEYTIKNISVYTKPFSSDIWSYELVIL